MNWYVYMLRCSDDTLYTGITVDLQRRVAEHNDSPKAAKYTRVRRPVQLVYFSQHKNRSEAAREEWRIKQLSRQDKVALIDS